MNFDSSDIRAAADSAVKTAWSPAFIAHSPPVTVQTDFPRAFIAASQVPMQRGQSGDTTQRDVRQSWQLQIVGQFRWPSTVTTLYEDAEAQANAVIALLTADAVRFAGWLYDVTNVAYEWQEDERMYEVTVSMTVYKIVGR